MFLLIGIQFREQVKALDRLKKFPRFTQLSVSFSRLRVFGNKAIERGNGYQNLMGCATFVKDPLYTGEGLITKMGALSGLDQAQP